MKLKLREVEIVFQTGNILELSKPRRSGEENLFLAVNSCELLEGMVEAFTV